MNKDQATKLRAPFPPERVGKLPKAGREFDFVGHAWVTDRLIEVDPEWTYELGDRYERGQQTVQWITLTVCGVTRPGVGIVSSRKDDLEKELVSDALKNAAMRFGVALDCWAKEESHAPAEKPAEMVRDHPADNAKKAARAAAREAAKAAAQGRAKQEKPVEDAVQDAFPGAEPVEYNPGEEPF